jgi:hypothetical protein
MKKMVWFAVMTALALAGGALAQAPGSPAPAPAPAPAPKAPKAQTEKAPAKKSATFPFRGTLKAVDKDAMTLTLAGKEKDRVIHVTSQTRFTKDGKPAVLADGVVGEEVAGSARKTEDGRTVAVSVRFGPAPQKSGKAAKSGKKSKTEAAP